MSLRTTPLPPDVHTKLEFEAGVDYHVTDCVSRHFELVDARNTPWGHPDIAKYKEQRVVLQALGWQIQDALKALADIENRYRTTP